jgi:hypothetical protein
MFKHNVLTACNINVFDGHKLLQTKMRGTFYRHNPACLSDKRKRQVTNRMYRGIWT